jgi:Zn-dependent peptidase ImmA (M78 family)/DNA-binding XRE family transcriptional regulator
MISKKLKTLREDVFRYTLNDVEKKTGIGSSSLSDFENNKREPSISQLTSLANLYNISISHFFENSDSAFNDIVLWREEPKNDTLKAELESNFKKLCRQYKNLEIWTKSPSETNLQKLFFETFPSNENDVRFQAKNIHKQLDLGSYPGESLLRILEEKYFIKIFSLNLEYPVSAACYHSKELGSAVMLNINSSAYRRNYDLAHELFHLLTWNFIHNREKSIMEDYANCFASELLMPEFSILESVKEFSKETGNLTYDDINSISRRFAVSIDAMMWRIAYIYKLKEKIDIKQTIQEIKNYTASYLPECLKDKFPLRYKDLAYEALKLGEISTKQCANYLEITVSELMKLDLRGDDDYKINIGTV